jgi:hypothetical protein
LIAKELVSVLIEKQYLSRNTSGAQLAQPASHVEAAEPRTVGDE